MFRNIVVLAALGLIGCAEEATGKDDFGNPPTVEIEFPADGAVFSAGQDVEFAGYIEDRDGLEDLIHVSWHSEIDGTLATGDGYDLDFLQSINVSLSPGVHRVWLIAVDGAGNGRSQEINVNIVPADQ